MDPELFSPSKKNYLIHRVAERFLSNRIQIIKYTDSNASFQNSESNKSCAVCMDPILGHNDGIDLRLACNCRIHYECLVGYIRGQLSDRISLLRHGKSGIICPYISSEECQYYGVFFQQNISRRQQQRMKLSAKENVPFFINPTDLRQLVEIGTLLNKKLNNSLSPFLLSEVERFELWVNEGYLGNENEDENNLDPLHLATTKPCPVCRYRGTHYHGHHCHEISPFGGCPGCGTHYCYSCLSSAITNKNLRGDDWHCICGINAAL